MLFFSPARESECRPALAGLAWAVLVDKTETSQRWPGTTILLSQKFSFYTANFYL